MNVYKCIDYNMGTCVLVAAHNNYEAKETLLKEGYEDRFSILFVPKLTYNSLISCVIN